MKGFIMDAAIIGGIFFLYLSLIWIVVLIFWTIIAGIGALAGDD